VVDNDDDILKSIDFNLGEATEVPSNETSPQPVQATETQEALPETNPTTGLQNSSSSQNEQESQPGQVNNPETVDQNSGAYRRLYENLQTANSEVKSYKDKLSIYEKNSSQLDTIGLDQSTLLQAAQFYQGFKNSPEKFVTDLLANVKAAGYNINEQDSGIDTQAISRLIDQKLEPITGRYEAEEARTQELAEAQKTVDTFFTAIPSAKIHENVIAKMLGNNPNWSLEKAYDELRIWSIQNQYDLSKPLADQVEARKNVQQPSTTNQTNVPLNINSTSTGNVVTPQPILAEADDSFADIISKVMRENGLNID